MPAVGLGWSLDVDVIMADFRLQSEDDVTIKVFIILLFRDLYTGYTMGADPSGRAD